jgi:hypothetical protein
MIDQIVQVPHRLSFEEGNPKSHRVLSLSTSPSPDNSVDVLSFRFPTKTPFRISGTWIDRPCLLLTGRRNARLDRAMMGHLLLVERHKANEVGLANTIL